ncbi:methionine biosynthesis protein MetW [Pelagicoccus sp. SDUM812003]|uniref:methionine biosynthesis protein MetW n=1 Tax=Pelagicoccus sp. SDUM812003 TaxID=3041267 RepID=UPI00280ECD8C|nr:methionine biosynthesis protein MetW [Pelagicoccus sp. SDUM812003]MDQ8204257.1 methionine biosynthesis protein MetW [Pelagicoccus sp. SDUM812003]
MKDKRTVDMQVMRDWVKPGSRVLDLGCGRGVLLDYLKSKLGVEAVGVDLDSDKVRACVKRGLSVYMGDMMDFMRAFPDKHFDYVVCSRTLQELKQPATVIREALRVSDQMLVGFVNFAYWRNRVSMLLKGHRIRNEVYPTRWWDNRPSNPLSVGQFDRFCDERGVRVERRLCLAGNWRTPVRVLPNLFCGYALYALSEGRLKAAKSEASGQASA